MALVDSGSSAASPRLRPTPGQTVGPFFAFGLRYDGDNTIVHPWSPGAILLRGVVFDGAANPVPDALVELWGADSDGRVPSARGSRRRDAHTFTGFGRCHTDDEGRFEFWTRSPGAPAGAAAFFAVVLFARGLPDKLHTRIYVPSGDDVLDADPLLSQLSPEERRTLVAARTADGGLHHDLRLQGERETVFLVY